MNNLVRPVSSFAFQATSDWQHQFKMKFLIFVFLFIAIAGFTTADWLEEAKKAAETFGNMIPGLGADTSKAIAAGQGAGGKGGEGKGGDGKGGSGGGGIHELPDKWNEINILNKNKSLVK